MSTRHDNMNAKLQHAAIAIPNITPIPIFICHLFPSQCANPTITAYINSIESTTASTCTTPNLVLFIRYVDYAIARIMGTTEIIAISITVKTFIVNIENCRALSYAIFTTARVLGNEQDDIIGLYAEVPLL